MYRVGVEARHILQKRARQAVQPAKIALHALAATLVFGVVHASLSSGVRHNGKAVAITVVLLFAVVQSLTTFAAAVRYRTKRPSQGWIISAVCGWIALVAGYLLGEQCWHMYTAQYFVYGKMASYVNVDPMLDKGRSYMDAGTVYFKEGSYVDSRKGIAFHNGLTYCVAPIMRGNGSIPGATIDFWAVGTDCCGDQGTKFRCGDTSKARSGLRLLDDTSRSMYLLGVQEWSATTGIQVEHPVFFRWTRDPLMYQEQLYNTGWSAFWYHSIICFISAFIGTFFLQSALKGLRIE